MAQRHKAAIYARFSSENQRDESIDAQISAIENYARQNDIEIVTTYIDRAKSATTDQRPSFQEMIKMSSTGLFDTIIVHKLDRFARSKYDSAVYKQKLKVNNVRLISVTENLDGTPESLILESVLEGMAEYYSKNLAREILKGAFENAKKAIHTGGIPPLGFDVVDKKLVINEHEAKAVRLIFDMYANGHGYTSIINTLNDNGYKTKWGNSFGKNSLFEILRNEKYCGVFTYNKSSGKTPKGTYNRHAYKNEDEVIRIKGGCPAIVSNEVFEAVANRQKLNRHKNSCNREKQKYLLSGLVFCGKCGSPMHANRRRSNTQITFRCNRKNQNITCNSKEINMGYLEEYVLDELKNNIFAFNKVPSIMRMIEDHSKKSSYYEFQNVSELQHQLEEIHSTRKNIIQAIEDGISKEHFSNRLDELKSEEEYLRSNLIIANQPKAFHVTKKDVMMLVNNFNKMKAEDDFVGLRKIVLDFVKEIKIDDEKIDITLKMNFGDVMIDKKLPTMPKNISETNANTFKRAVV